MNEIRTLLFLELRSLYGINKFLHTRDRGQKNRFLGLLIAWVILIGVVFSYMGGLVYGLCFLGLGSVVPAYLVVLASLLILAFGIFTAGNRVFGSRGYDLLSSMPLRPRSIVLGRLLAMYGEDLVLTLVILLPGMVVYGICQRPEAGFFAATLVGAVFLPAIPLMISVLLGTGILAISSRVKRKSLVQSVLMVLLVAGVLLGSFSLENMAEGIDVGRLSAMAQSIAVQFGSLYPPSAWLGSAMLGESLWGLLLFILVSAGVMALGTMLISRCFFGLSQRLGNVSGGRRYQIGTMESRSLLKALYLREIRRYFSSSIYVTNTIIGPIMGLMLSVAVAIAGLDRMTQAIGAAIDLGALLPFVLAGVICMMTTTCTSISMEGRQFWTVKSLPIPGKALLDSKILMNLSLILPFFLPSVAALAIATKAGLWELLWLILIPGSVIGFCLVFGIAVNLRWHSFDWEKEEMVVKQSLPAAVGGFAGPLLALGMGALVFMVPAQLGNGIKALLCLLLAGITAWLYIRNCKVDLARLD